MAIQVHTAEMLEFFRVSLFLLGIDVMYKLFLPHFGITNFYMYVELYITEVTNLNILKSVFSFFKYSI